MNRFALYDSEHFGPPGASQLARAARRQDANHGLSFQKFFGHWQKQNGAPKLSQEALLAWLDGKDASGRRKSSQVVRCVGDPELLAEQAERIARLCGDDRHCFAAHLVTRLLTGLGEPHPTENGCSFHHTLGVPYLRGSSLKQIARLGAEDAGETVEADRVLGPDSAGAAHAAGTVSVLDGLPAKPVMLVAEIVNSHYGPTAEGYYGGTDPLHAGGSRIEPGDWFDPVPVTVLAVERHGGAIGSYLPSDAEAEFRFAVAPTLRSQEGDAARAAAWLRAGLERFGAGAKTGLDHGRFRSPGPSGNR